MITFFSKYIGIGGVEYLIINISKQLIIENRLSVKIICPNDSIIRKELRPYNKCIIWIQPIRNAVEKMVLHDDVVVKMDWGSTNLFYKTKAKLIYWEVLPRLTTELITNKKSFFKKAFLHKLINSGQFFCMDAATRNALPIDAKIQVFFLPIPVKKEKQTKVTNFNTKSIKIAYVGRAVPWKIYPILSLINNFSFHDIEVELNLFTDNRAEFEAYFQKECTCKEKIKFNFYINNTLDEVLQKINSNPPNLAVGMGTSALNLASLGLPTLVVDICNNIYPKDYKYCFVKDISDFSLGYDLSIDSINYQDRYSFSDILVLLNKQGKEIGSSCKMYVEKHHNVEIISKLLIQYCNKAKINFKVIWFFFKLISMEAKIKDLI